MARSITGALATAAWMATSVQAIRPNPGDCVYYSPPLSYSMQYRVPPFSGGAGTDSGPCGDNNSDGIVNADDYVDFWLKAKTCTPNGPVGTNAQQIIDTLNELPKLSLLCNGTQPPICNDIAIGAARVFQSELGRFPTAGELALLNGSPGNLDTTPPCGSTTPPHIPFDPNAEGPSYCLGINCLPAPIPTNPPADPTPGVNKYPMCASTTPCDPNDPHEFSKPPNAPPRDDDWRYQNDGLDQPDPGGNSGSPADDLKSKPLDGRGPVTDEELIHPGSGAGTDGSSPDEWHDTHKELEFPASRDDVIYSCLSGGGGGGGGRSGNGVQSSVSRTESKSDDGTSTSRNGPCGGNAGGNAPTGGGGATVVSTTPVRADSGAKNEQVVDLRIPLTGRDLTVTRTYTSDPHWTATPLVGNGWSLSVFGYLYKQTDGSLTASGSVAGSAGTFQTSNGSVWTLPNASRQTITKARLDLTSTTSVSVWRLSNPGVGECDYYRVPDGSDPSGTSIPSSTWSGLLLEQRDLNGNKRHYDYFRAGTSWMPRLASITCTNALGQKEAVLSFQWYVILGQGGQDHPLDGKLARIQVQRFPDPNAQQGTETQRIQYTYKHATDGFSPSVGTNGDLIQVVRFNRVDSGLNSAQPIDIPPPPSHPTGPLFPHRMQITQYRYHGGSTINSSDPRIACAGGTSQLKAVFPPEQMEYYSQKLNRTNTFQFADFAPRDAAWRLMQLPDDATACSDESQTMYKVVDLAAKWVGYDTTDTTTRRVTSEYVQAGCGCSTGVGHAMKQTYSYVDWPGGRTMRIDESGRSGSSMSFDVPYRTTYYDMAFLGTANVPVIQSYAVVEPGTNPRKWAWKYEFDSATGIPQATRHPSSNQDYTPATASTPPTVTPQAAGTGFVERFEFTNNRLTALSVDDAGGTPRTLWRRTYGSADTSSTRTYLPTKVERFAVAGSASDADVGTTWYTYGFRGNSTSSSDVAWRRTIIEAEKVSENGPATSNPMVETFSPGDGSTAYGYSIYEVYDAAGRLAWRRNADRSVSHLEYATSALAPTTVTLNANPSGVPGDGGLSTAGWGTIPGSTSPLLGGTLVYQYAYDLDGQMTKSVSPTGRALYWYREMRDLSILYSANELPGHFYYAKVELPHKIASDGYNGSFDQPALITFFTSSGNIVGRAQLYLQAGTNTAPYGSGGPYPGIASLVQPYTPPQPPPVASRVTNSYAISGALVRSRVWHSTNGNGVVPAGSGAPVDSDSYYDTTYSYDSFGRVLSVSHPNRTVTQVMGPANTSYDALDRPLGYRIGSSSSATLTQAQALYYDDTSNSGVPGHGTGDGNLSWSVTYTGESGSAATRVTNFQYDNRDRLTAVIAPQAPHAAIVYDNLNRPVEVGSFSQPPASGIASSGRLSYSKLFYNQRGARYRTLTATNPDNSTPTFLSSDLWFDAVGRVVTSAGPDSPGTTVVYDGLGRATTMYVHDRAEYTSSPTYENAVSVANSHVLEQMDVRFDSLGRPDLTTARVRVHDSTALGALSGSPTQAVATYDGVLFDGASRPIAKVEFGTNAASTDSTPFRSNTSAPTWPPPGGGGVPSDFNTNTTSWWYNTIVHQTVYNSRGLPILSIDPENKVTRSYFDALGRVAAVVENYSSSAIVSWNTSLLRWSVSGMSTTDGSLNRMTSYTYAIPQGYVRQHAHMLDTNGVETVQTTQYNYGTTIAAGTMGSLVNSGHLVSSVQYPDRTTGAPGQSVSYAYDVTGALRALQDQNGTVHQYTHDALGRVTDDTVATFATGIDTAVGALHQEFDSAGRLFKAESKSGSTVLNAVQFGYNGLGQVTDVYQNASGPVNTAMPTGNGTVRVGYEYETTLANSARPKSLVYPDGWKLTSIYNSTIDSAISRPTSLNWVIGGDGISPLVNYSYLGLGFFAGVDYPTPNIQLDRTYDGATGKRRLNSHTSQSQGVYPGWDRFGRVARHAWMDGTNDTNAGQTQPTKPAIIEDVITYDHAGNRTKTYDRRPGVQFGNRDLEATFDGLHRLTLAKRGKRVDASTWTPGKNSQSWKLDQLGNWTETAIDGNSNDVYTDSGEKEVRAFNMVNELVSRQFVSSPTTPVQPLSYDNNGNLVSQKMSSSTTRNSTYDAWNRPTAVTSTTTGRTTTVVNLGSYEYNALHWRTAKNTKVPRTETTGYSGERRVYTYDAAWRLVQEDVDDDFTNNPGYNTRVQHSWGLRYVDDAVEQRRGSYSGANADLHASVSYDKEYFHLTDVQYSTTTLVDSAGNLKERVQYAPYGQAFHRWPGDFDGNDATNSSDQSAMAAKLNAGTSSSLTLGGSDYDADFDLNRDGVIDSTDLSILTTTLLGKSSVGAGQISDSSSTGPQNTIGYCGYVFSSELTQYHVRNRWYEPSLGRWTSRDPAGYVDGANLYEYAMGRALNLSDPTGLITSDVKKAGPNPNSGGCGGGPRPRTRSQRIGEFFGDLYDILDTPSRILRNAVIDVIDDAVQQGYEQAEREAGGEPDTADVLIYAASHFLGFQDFGDFVYGVNAVTGETLEGEDRVYAGMRGIASVVLAFSGPLEKLGVNLCLDACFTSDTPVLTEHGLKPIDQVEIGERVWSVDTQEGTVELRAVTNVFESHAEEIVVVAIGSECVRCTPEHPFWVEGRGWVEAQDLYDGALVRTSQGLVDRVVHVELRAEPTTVYNLEVQGGHTYFVGQHAVLVHNACLSGVYKIFFKNGERYVGQSVDIATRVPSHFAPSGKFAGRANDISHVEYDLVNGGKGMREFVEQQWIWKDGGVSTHGLKNIRNPIGPNRLPNYVK